MSFQMLQARKRSSTGGTNMRSGFVGLGGWKAGVAVVADTNVRVRVSWRENQSRTPLSWSWGSMTMIQHTGYFPITSPVIWIAPA